ncbi:ATPase with chaperone activity [Limnohabitans sp. Hippo3]|uniref:ATPase with chaperone activity n=1 Tax=Limnohabitans sp. Hippo3 TaxID=1597956 RepID=UPI000D383C00|nr:ATPase with chaperone activity [Limnohabitans sp. Hippo3]PUE44020.1 ATPase with chaperone activity [Limnohabitans sp. Hippo3]
MTEEFQIHIPPSFMALYVPPGKIKPTLGLRDMAARYELCEDLANLLTEQAANMQFTMGITEELVLQQCELGLLAEPAVVSPVEARWVVCRLAELLNWPMAELLSGSGPETPVT